MDNIGGGRFAIYHVSIMFLGLLYCAYHNGIVDLTVLFPHVTRLKPVFDIAATSLQMFLSLTIISPFHDGLHN